MNTVPIIATPNSASFMANAAFCILFFKFVLSCMVGSLAGGLPTVFGVSRPETSKMRMSCPVSFIGRLSRTEYCLITYTPWRAFVLCNCPDSLHDRLPRCSTQNTVDYVGRIPHTGNSPEIRKVARFTETDFEGSTKT